MAAADYRLCDVCDGKVFYDANLNYEQGREALAEYDAALALADQAMGSEG